MLLKRSSFVLVAMLLVCSTASPASRSPARSSGDELVFRCTDANGQLRFGDSQPPECVGRDTQVLNERGTVIRTIEGDQSRAARLQREVQEAEQRRIREERAQRDRMLIDTYQSVEDIERLRDQRLELLAAQVDVTRQNIVSMRERQTRLEEQIARFRPYNTAPDAPPLPDHLAEEMVNTVNSLRNYDRTIRAKQGEQDQLREAFRQDIARFKQLKGIR